MLVIMASQISLILFLAFIISAVRCREFPNKTTTGFYYQLDNGTIIYEDLTHPSDIQPRDFDGKKINLLLYTKNRGRDSPCYLTVDSTCDEWLSCGFDPSKPCLILVHGYVNDHFSNAVQWPKDAHMDVTDHNIIICGWGEWNIPYLTACWNIKNIGVAIARSLNSLRQECGLFDFKKITAVGHSLGAHICGIISANCDERFHKIIALDCASPLVEDYALDERFDREDADYTLGIHTSWPLGINVPFCHVDMYPNWGYHQCGCSSWDITGACDHCKAYEMYCDALREPEKFRVDCRCETAAHIEQETCSHYDEILPLFGYHCDMQTFSGNYYCDMNRCYG